MFSILCVDLNETIDRLLFGGQIMQRMNQNKNQVFKLSIDFVTCGIIEDNCVKK